MPTLALSISFRTVFLFALARGHPVRQIATTELTAIDRLTRHLLNIA
jgi:hypothetical protein